MNVVEKLIDTRNRTLVAWGETDSWDAKSEELALLIADDLESRFLVGREGTSCKVVAEEIPKASLLRTVNLLRAAGYKAYWIRSSFSERLCKEDLVLTRGSDGRAKLRKPLDGEEDRCRDSVYVSLFKDEE